MDFKKHKQTLNHELDQFNSILGEILPRYVLLVRKTAATADETKELGDIEHFLIEINSKISLIKNRLDQDLFGETMQMYYKLKEEAKRGDITSKDRLEKLRSTLHESIKGDTFFNWN
jgi:hypothetical protein